MKISTKLICGACIEVVSDDDMLCQGYTMEVFDSLVKDHIETCGVCFGNLPAQIDTDWAEAADQPQIPIDTERHAATIPSESEGIRD